jgi:hypothetical protein
MSLLKINKKQKPQYALLNPFLGDSSVLLLPATGILNFGTLIVLPYVPKIIWSVTNISNDNLMF